MGMTVKGALNQVNRWFGKSCSGESGKKAIKVRAPMVIIGAVSPIARDRAMIMPVIMLPED
jgi:hypothetical protein